MRLPYPNFPIPRAIKKNYAKTNFDTAPNKFDLAI